MNKDDERSPESLNPLPLTDRRKALAAGMTEAEYQRFELQRLSALVTSLDVTPGDGARTLAERQRNDLKVLEGIKDFNQEAWKAMTPVQRLELCREVERALATAQGREPSRVYACQLLPEAMGAADRIDHERALRSEKMMGQFIRIEQRLLRNVEGFPPSFGTIVTNLAEECRHAYQLSVIHQPGRHPEVDDARRALWYSAYVNYEADNKTFSGYLGNELEVDAKRYAGMIATSLHDQRF